MRNFFESVFFLYSSCVFYRMKPIDTFKSILIHVYIIYALLQLCESYIKQQ